MVERGEYQGIIYIHSDADPPETYCVDLNYSGHALLDYCERHVGIGYLPTARLLDC